jgi:DNA-binding protein H-NS
MVTLSQIEHRIASLQKKADDLRRKQSASVISSIKKMMSEYGLSLEDLEASVEESPPKRGRPAGSKNSARALTAPAANAKLPPKYRDPESGATWSGHARPPAWIKDVKDRTRFLIDATSEQIDTSVRRTKRKV